MPKFWKKYFYWNTYWYDHKISMPFESAIFNGFFFGFRFVGKLWLTFKILISTGEYLLLVSQNIASSLVGYFTEHGSSIGVPFCAFVFVGYSWQRLIYSWSRNWHCVTCFLFFLLITCLFESVESCFFSVFYRCILIDNQAFDFFLDIYNFWYN